MKKLLALIRLAIVLTAGAFATVAANPADESNSDNDPDPCAVFFSSEPDPDKSPQEIFAEMVESCSPSEIEESLGATEGAHSASDLEAPGPPRRNSDPIEQAPRGGPGKKAESEDEKNDPDNKQDPCAVLFQGE